MHRRRYDTGLDRNRGLPRRAIVAAFGVVAVALNLVDKELKRMLETWFSQKSGARPTHVPGRDHIFRL